MLNRVKSSQEKQYLVQQGMISPRDNSIGFRDWRCLPTLREAERVARELCKSPDWRCEGGIARILEVREILCFHDGCINTLDNAA